VGIEKRQNQVVRNLESFQNAPSTPPVVWANEVELSITQFEWKSLGEISSHLVQTPESAVVTDVPGNWPHLVLKFSTAVKPAALVIGLFPETNEFGFPDISTEISIDPFESDTSLVSFDDGAMTVLLKDIAELQFAVIRVAYINIDNQGLSEQLSTASWAMRFVGLPF
jgi:hypothetical protein